MLLYLLLLSLLSLSLSPSTFLWVICLGVCANWLSYFLQSINLVLFRWFLTRGVNKALITVQIHRNKWRHICISILQLIELDAFQLWIGKWFIPPRFLMSIYVFQLNYSRLLSHYIILSLSLSFYLRMALHLFQCLSPQQRLFTADDKHGCSWNVCPQILWKNRSQITNTDALHHSVCMIGNVFSVLNVYQFECHKWERLCVREGEGEKSRERNGEHAITSVYISLSIWT